MRKVEERILREEDQRAAFRLFFEEFVSAIVREAGRALRDTLTVRALAQAVLQEGRARDLAGAERGVRRDLAEILAVFEGIDPHLDAVAEVVARLERRIASAVRYNDHRGSARIERATAALRAVGAAGASLDMPVPSISLLRPPIGEPHLFTPRIKRAPIVSQPLPVLRTDPAIEAFVSAKDAYRLRTTVTRESVGAFLERQLGRADRIRGSEIRIRDVDAFVVFQRLREIDVLFDGALAERYQLLPAPGRIANGWLDCPDFLVVRVEPGRPARR